MKRKIVFGFVGVLLVVALTLILHQKYHFLNFAPTAEREENTLTEGNEPDEEYTVPTSEKQEESVSESPSEETGSLPEEAADASLSGEYPFLAGKVYPLGEPVKAILTSGKFDVTYSNLRVFGSAEEAGISADRLTGSNRVAELGYDYEFVLLDIRIENHGAVGNQGEMYASEIEEYNERDNTAGVFWITDFVKRLKGSESGDTFYLETDGYSDLDYFSEGVQGRYYHFVMNQEDDRTFTIGFYVPKELLEAKDLVIGASNRPYGEGESAAKDEKASWVALRNDGSE